MKYAKIGTRDLWVSRLLFGTLTIGPLQKNLPVEEGAEIICHAARRGVTFFDTAECYGTYPYIKKALAVFPNLSVCTKTYAFDREGAARSLKLAQEGIGRERIDVFLLHEQESIHTLRGHTEALSYFIGQRERGVIGAVGISTHHIAAVKAAAKWEGLDVVFVILNRGGIGIVDGTLAQMEEAVAEARRAGRSILAMKALGGGHLIDDRENALSFVRDHPLIDCVAIGMQSKAEVDFNIAMMEGRIPDAQCALETSRAVRKLHIQEECEGCGRCAARCGQGALSIQDGKAAVCQSKCIRCGYCASVCPFFCIKVI